jgi:hypothetical protein
VVELTFRKHSPLTLLGTFFANVPFRSMLHREIENLPAIDANTLQIMTNVEKKRTRAKMAENAGINPLDISTANATERALKVNGVKRRSNQWQTIRSNLHLIHPSTIFNQTIPVAQAIIFKWRSNQPS